MRVPWLTGDLAARFQAIADSMTDYVRAGPNSQRATGASVRSVVFVRVHWLWLALPLFEGLAAVTLLAVTVVWSRQSEGTALWKSSALALLFSRYTARDGLLEPDPAGPAGVEDFAKSVKAQLL